jgi:hypothetical protein
MFRVIPLIGVAVATLIVCGCTRGSQSVSVPTSSIMLGGLLNGPTLAGADYKNPRDLSTARRDLIYVTDSFANAVLVFSQKGNNQPAIGQIVLPGSDRPGSLFVDPALNLYVSDNNFEYIYVFLPGSTTPRLKLIGAGNDNDAVVVDKLGAVYVAARVGGNPPSGVVVRYEKGQTTPSKIIHTFPPNRVPAGIALDHAGNLYIAVEQWTRGGDVQVLKFQGHSTQFTNVGIHNPGYTCNGCLTIDRNNDIVLGDNSGNVDVYPPGSTTPSHVLNGVNAYGGISLNYANTELWVANGIQKTVLGVSYPSGTILDTITSTISTQAIAASPDGSP